MVDEVQNCLFTCMYMKSVSTMLCICLLCSLLYKHVLLIFIYVYMYIEMDCTCVQVPVIHIASVCVSQDEGFQPPLSGLFGHVLYKAQPSFEPYHRLIH